jgi:hypothetical protein
MRKPLFLIVSLLALFLTAEAAGHIFLVDPFVISDLYSRATPPLWYRGKPHATINYEGCLLPIPATEIRLNSAGFRSPEADPTDRRPQVLFFGDSNTLGIGVNYEETFCALLAKALPDYQILNRAVGEYNILQQFALFQQIHGSEALAIFVLPGYYFALVRPLDLPAGYRIVRHSRLSGVYFLASRFARIGGLQREIPRSREILALLKEFAANHKNVWYVLLQSPGFDTREFAPALRDDGVVLDCTEIFRTHEIVNDEELMNAEGHRLVAQRILAEIRARTSLRTSD